MTDAEQDAQRLKWAAEDWADYDALTAERPQDPDRLPTDPSRRNAISDIDWYIKRGD
jgi:hypothetical protein|tara:strand:+ start:819 stop:989 length:171 start_codon:yes stop_codon:yes gene_type:complete